MKLYYSKNSPYARVTRIAAIECGIAEKIEHISVVNRTPDNPLLMHSPVCRVPTLVCGDLVLGEARNICAYFDHITDRPMFLAYVDGEMWHELALESMVVGFLDGIVVWARENRRDDSEKSAFILEIERQRAERCLNHFEIAIQTEHSPKQVWNFSNIALACALGIMEYAGFQDGWTSTRPALAKWFKDQASRPSMQATRPVA